MNILIVDDAASDHELCVNLLAGEADHYHFLHAYTAREGLAIYHEKPVDCILLDYHLPDMDGLEVLRQISSEKKNIPVVMMTGEGNEMIAVNAMKMGSQDYIPKKVVTAAALKRAVNRAAERSDLLRKMERYRFDLERSNRDLEQFANIVAHDLKSPLRAVIQHLTLIKNHSEECLDAQSRRSLDFAVDGAQRMQMLIDGLFTYARLGFSEVDLSTVDLHAVLENTKRDLAVLIKQRGVKLSAEPMPMVHGNMLLLTQVMQNLVGNAIKYCKGEPSIHISAALHEGQWRIGVHDNGIGIPAEQQGKIFTIFRRLHKEEEYPGIGIGLAICERIVKQHGGTISVQSEPGKGSVFVFTLGAAQPLSQERQVAHG